MINGDKGDKGDIGPQGPQGENGIGTLKEIKAIVNSLMEEKDKVKYHIGKIIMETENVNPSTYLGFGEWVLWGSGRVPAGIDPEDEDFNEVEKTGGEKEHVLTIEEIPNHRHEKLYSSGGKERKAGYGSTGTHTGTLNENTSTDFESLNTGYTGGDRPHNNLQPYIVCYMWKRIA